MASRLRVLLAAAAILAGSAVIAFFLQAHSSGDLLPSQPSADAAQAHFAGGLLNVDYKIDINHLVRDAPPPEPGPPGAHYVRMTATFHNGSGRSYRMSPQSLTLIDPQGRSHTIAFAAGGSNSCKAWSTSTLAAGESGGPVPLCFWADGPANGKLTLVWDPDVSFFLLSSPVRIPLQ